MSSVCFREDIAAVIATGMKAHQRREVLAQIRIGGDKAFLDYVCFWEGTPAG